MALPHHYLIALISPSGRISQFPFALLAVLLALAHIWLFGKIADNELGFSWNVYTVALFAMLWMQFCIFTRRMRDTGTSGFFLVPVLMIAIVIFVAVLDPDMVRPDGMDNKVGDITVRWSLRFIRSLYIALFIYGIRAGGETGPNAYGPEFGDTFATMTDASDALDRIKGSGQVVHRFDRTRKTPKDWGNRKRPKGFGRRG